MYGRIKDMREDRDMTQSKISAELRIPRARYASYELGICDLPTDFLIKLAVFHSTSTDYLLGETNLPRSGAGNKDHADYRYRELRKQSGLTQGELAQKINMSQEGYSKYETGRCDMPTEILIALARIYCVSVDYLLGISDTKQRSE